MQRKIITIALGLPDNNAGGSALGITTVNILKMKFPGCKLYYLSSHHNRRLIQHAYPYMREYCPNVEIIPFPFYRRQDFSHIKNPSKRIILQTRWIIGSVLSISYLIFPFLGKFNTSLKIIRISNLLVGRGTQVFYDHEENELLSKIKSIISKYNLCFPFLYAQRIKIPYIIFPQSFGPIYIRTNKLVIKKVLSGAELVMCRENESYIYLNQYLGVSSLKLKVVPDTVFSFGIDENVRRKIEIEFDWLHKKKYCVFLVRDLIGEFTDTKLVENYFVELATNLFNEHIVDKILILTQCNAFENYDYFENDVKISKRLFELIRHVRGDIELLDNTFSPFELKTFYCFARYVFSVRLHSAILSITAGTPAFAISYFGNKTTGIYNLVGLNEYLLTPDELLKDKTIMTIRKVEKNYEEERKKIAGLSENLKHMILEYI